VEVAPVELRHLRYVAVAEEGSLNRAAQRLLLSQPSLSRQLRDLEKELGVQLLERHARGVTLTPEGSGLLAHGRQVLRMADATRRMVTDPERHPQVVVGVPPTISGDWFLALLEAIRSRRLPSPPSVLEAYSVEQIRLLRDGRIDVGIVVQRPTGGVKSVALSKHSFGLAVRPGHALVGRSSYAIEDLEGLRVLARSREQVPAAHDVARREIESAGVFAEWEITRFTEHARACAVAANADAVFCGAFTARRSLPDWNWGPLTDLRTTMSLWLAWPERAREDVRAVVDAFLAEDLTYRAADWNG
jgi:DNA-binding transcriptional LysR family regulator